MCGSHKSVGLFYLDVYLNTSEEYLSITAEFILPD